MEPPDEELVEQCRRELPYVLTSFESLLRRYEPLVYRTCQRYLQNAEEAEEASQDVLMRVFHGLARFEGRGAFRAWLFRIVTNVCASRYKTLKQAAQHQSAYSQQVERRAPSGTVGRTQDAVAEPLERLSEPDRQILILRHVCELTLEEISQVQFINLSASKISTDRAEDRFRHVYEPW